MIGAAAGFVLGIAAYAIAMLHDLMPGGYEITSAGIVLAVLGYGADRLVRAFRSGAA